MFVAASKGPGAPPVNAQTTTPSFDCARTDSEIETLVCSDERLAGLDAMMAETFTAAVAALDGAADQEEATNRLKAEQRGWIKGRNDCWKATDRQACVWDSYERRIAFLEARYFLADASDPVFYECENDPANEIVATFVSGSLPSVRLERGDAVEIGVLSPSASGSRYEGTFGIVFWTKGDEALVEWPQGNSFSCVVRQQ
ncbi:MliC family protein [Stappia albiluteola]|uniref:MliC family protein n=1 Tax=Stappia albiluteola TaxID=2758565 RepID=UPI001AD8DF2B|nr:MliC family protein [Stappia albiluteola]